MSILGNSDIIKFMDDSGQDENNMDSTCGGNDLSLWGVTKIEDFLCPVVIDEPCLVDDNPKAKKRLKFRY